ncbi:MAG: DNA-processing protein DprA [Steroidobacteraceae bacterium]|jgi:DNA processing protein|nr:DNA-processing protein DprA [Steroidobacteraceae bacterium]
MPTTPEALCRLARAPRLDAARLLECVAASGSIDALVAASPASLEALGLHPATVAALCAPDLRALERDLAAIERHGLVLLPATDPAYPPRLAALAAAPPVLWVRGAVASLSAPQLAVVGSRHPTALGRRTAREFAYHFASAGLAITSGLALGIDAASHDGALLAGGRTIAVLGTGLDTMYPTENAALAERIVDGGGTLLSEFPPRTEPRRANFPQRNRLISGLSLGVLVVEAARHSGSLSTARWAGEQGREVFAVPGSIHSPLSKGCHDLIRQGATLVEKADDVVSEFRHVLTQQSLARLSALARAPCEGAGALDNPAEILLDAVGFEPTSVDALLASTGLSAESVASMLLVLELEGRIETLPGGRYIRAPGP